MRKALVKLTALLCFFSIDLQAQAQDFDEWFGGNFMLTDLIDAPRGYCLDLEGYASTTDTSAPVIVHSCKQGQWKDGTWRANYPNIGQIYLPDYELCVAAGALEHDAEVFLEECSTSPLQYFAFRGNGTVESITDDEQKFCLAVGEVSRPTGSNLRRQTRMADCATTPEEYTRWILPAEDAVYTSFSTFDPERAAAATAASAAAQPAGGAAAGMGAGGAGMGAGGAGMGAGGMGAGGGAPATAGAAIGGQFNGACAPCHGPSGDGLASEFAPRIAGQEEWYLERQLLNFANGLRGGHEGERWATQMQNHLETFNATQIAGFAETLAAIEGTPAPITVEGDIARGEQLYTTSCVACHGAEALGNESLGAPRLSGMSDWYMVTQLEKFKYGFRGDHPEDTFGLQMALFVKTLPDDQAMSDITAYINTLR